MTHDNTGLSGDFYAPDSHQLDRVAAPDNSQTVGSVAPASLYDEATAREFEPSGGSVSGNPACPDYMVGEGECVVRIYRPAAADEWLPIPTRGMLDDHDHEYAILTVPAGFEPTRRFLGNFGLEMVIAGETVHGVLGTLGPDEIVPMPDDMLAELTKPIPEFNEVSYGVYSPARFIEVMREAGCEDAEQIVIDAIKEYKAERLLSETGFDPRTMMSCDPKLVEKAARRAKRKADTKSRNVTVTNGTGTGEPAVARMTDLIVNGQGNASDHFDNALRGVAGSGLVPAFNELSQQVELVGTLPWDENYGRVLSDHTLRLARHLLLEKHRDAAFRPGKENVMEAIMTLAYERKFNPVLDYLDGLAWDRTPRVDRLFPAYFRVEDDPYSRAVSKCFLISAVRRMRQPGCKVDTMPILKGAQGVGKSSGLKALFGEDWFSDADLDLKNKDAAITLEGVWCQEFAELSSMRKSDVDTLKAFVSRAKDRYRKPYDRIASDQPRKGVFAGSVNESGFLNDATGNRRFWPLTVQDEVDLAGLIRDRDQLWAEANFREKEGESHVLDRSLWAVAAEQQAEETIEDPWADRLRRIIQCTNDLPDDQGWREGVGPDRAHTSALLELMKERSTKANAQRLRTVIEHCLHWTHKRGVKILGKTAAGYVADPGDKPAHPNAFRPEPEKPLD